MDTILQRAPGELVGQSVTSMPSGRLYTTATRAKLHMEDEVTSLEIDYDATVKDDQRDWHVL